MSVKLKSVEELRRDLAGITRTWPGGIPAEQQDIVNATNAELRRRGEPVVGPASAPRAPSPTAFRDAKAMSDEQLMGELAMLSKILNQDPGNEEAQNRFADIRFELRTRKNGEAPPVPSTPSVVPRMLDIPDVDDVGAPMVEDTIEKRIEARDERRERSSFAILGGSLKIASSKLGVHVEYTTDHATLQCVMTPDEALAILSMLSEAAAKARG